VTLTGASRPPRPTLEALARAVCPPAGLTADLLARTVDETERTIAALGPPAPALLGAAARWLEASTVRPRHGWRRFSHLDTDTARQVVADLDARRPAWSQVLRLLGDLVVICHYEQPEVRAAVGYLPDPWIAERDAGRRERWGTEIAAHARLLLAPSPLVPSADRDTTTRPPGAIRPATDLPRGVLECDVVVVGSGAGGGVVAAELAEAGLDVVVLEEGDHHPTESFSSSTTEMLRTLYRDAGASTTIGRVPVGYSEGRGVGGSTVVNGAMAFRAPDRVLAAWAERTGLARLGPGGLDEEYARVERFLSVSRQDPGSVGRDQELLRDGARRLGWQVDDNTRAQVHCAGCNVCPWGCPTGAKQSTLVSYLPRAVAYGATVWAGCRVDRIEFRGKRAVGVRGTLGPASGGRTFAVRARRVVVCCGAIQTPALLLRSGVRSPSGRVGHGLAVHPGSHVTGVFDEPVDGWRGAHQAHQVREFEDDGIVLAAVNLPPSLVARSLSLRGAPLGRAMEEYNHMVTAGSLVEDSGTGRVRAVGLAGTPVASYRVTDRDAHRVVRSLALVSEALFAAGARTVHTTIDGLPPLTSPRQARALPSTPIHPTRLALSTVHLMGTAGLGADPLSSVCDPAGAVHDTADLYVADASLFPGPVGVNPMLTIMALATRVAGGIIEGWP
jgi:choline dehydrogenase-like flavoprotein